MRLWHYKLVEYLPNLQLLSQWRELNSIYANQNKHILINYIYKYSTFDLLIYSKLVICEMEKRRLKLKSETNFKNYFGFGLNEITGDNFDILECANMFQNHHNNIYLKICAWNLYEKYLCGQKGFSQECIDKIKEIIGENK